MLYELKYSFYDSFYTFAHLKRRINDEKNKQRCKNLISSHLEMTMKFKNLFLYKICLVFFLYQIQILLYLTYFAQHSYLCYGIFRFYA